MPDPRCQDTDYQRVCERLDEIAAIHAARHRGEASALAERLKEAHFGAYLAWRRESLQTPEGVSA